MSQVRTARGPGQAGALGQTSMHEHVFVRSADVKQNYPAEWGSEDERVADAVPRLRPHLCCGDHGSPEAPSGTH